MDAHRQIVNVGKIIRKGKVGRKVVADAIFALRLRRIARERRQVAGTDQLALRSLAEEGAEEVEFFLGLQVAAVDVLLGNLVGQRGRREWVGRSREREQGDKGERSPHAVVVVLSKL